MVQEFNLDDLFAEAAAVREAPSPALTARVLADADRLQPRAGPLRAEQPAPQGWVRTLADWFGGGMSLAGMSAAAVAGLYLGLAQPASVLALTDLVTGTTTVESLDLLPASGTLWAQE